MGARPSWWSKAPGPLLADRERLLEAARADGLEHRFAEIEALMRPGIELVVEDGTGPIGRGVESRLGGAPDLPPGHAWPTWNDAPLAFIGQLVLSPELARLDLEGVLPAGGVLSFFAQLDPAADDYCEKGSVLLFPSVEELVSTAPPSPGVVLPRSVPVTPAPRLAVAPRDVPAVEALELSRQELRAYHDDLFLASLPDGPSHRLVGWPTAATRYDMRGRRFLAQLDSDDRVGLEMGDVGALRFYVDGAAADAGSLEGCVCTLDEA